MEWEMHVYTNLGGFVANSHSSIRCDDSAFDGNVLIIPAYLSALELRSDEDAK
jgi:hypothetical protein